MGTYSIVRAASIGSASRIDPDYYQPEYLELSKRLITSPLAERGLLRRYIHSAINFGAYSLCNNIVFVDSGVPYLYTQDIRDNFVDLDNPHFITTQVDALLHKSQVVDRQVLLTMAGVYLGRSAVFDYGIHANSNQAIAKITVREELLNPYYLSTFLNSLYGNFQIRRNKTGTARDNINLGQIQDLYICLPSRSFQLGIEQEVKAAKQHLLDSRKLFTDAENLLLAEVGLLDWIPEHELAFIQSYSRAEQARRLDAEYFQPRYRRMFERLPSTVMLDRLGQLVDYYKGIEVGSSAYDDSGVAFWRVSNLTKRGLDDSNVNFIKEDLYQELRSRYEPKEGELLLSKDATPGVALYLDAQIKGIISGGILRLAIKADIHPHYLELALNSPMVQLQIEQAAGGSIIRHWKPSEISKTIVPRLPQKTEHHIATLVKRSHDARREAAAILRRVKQSVETAIDDTEHAARSVLTQR